MEINTIDQDKIETLAYGRIYEDFERAFVGITNHLKQRDNINTERAVELAEGQINQWCEGIVNDVEEGNIEL